MIPTILAVEIAETQVIGGVVAVIVAILGSNVVSAWVTARSMRRKIGSEADRNDTDSMLALGKEFRQVLQEFAQAKRESISAEERHSLERIASTEELCDLREKVENCEREHLEWDDCKAEMLGFLVRIEGELQQITSQPTLLTAVAALKGKIEES